MIIITVSVHQLFTAEPEYVNAIFSTGKPMPFGLL